MEEEVEGKEGGTEKEEGGRGIEKEKTKKFSGLLTFCQVGSEGRTDRHW